MNANNGFKGDGSYTIVAKDDHDNLQGGIELSNVSDSKTYIDDCSNTKNRRNEIEYEDNEKDDLENINSTIKKLKSESEGLLSSRAIRVDQTASAQKLYRNFLLMCFAFSCNHGAVVSCLAYASTELGPVIGSYGSSRLYVFYTITAFFFSKPLVSLIGPKRGLLCGVGGYCIYVAGFLFALMSSAIALPVFLISVCMGGIAGGILWTAQGRYFAKNAKLYSDAICQPISETNASFAGIFAFAYLGWEMVLKVLATVIFLTAPENASYIVFSTYAIIAAASLIAMNYISDLGDEGSSDTSFVTICTNSIAAAKLATTDFRLTFLLPFQVAFGFASSFVPYYVLGFVIAGSESLGGAWVGLLSAIIVLAGALTAFPASCLANKTSKAIVMAIGGLCMAYAGFAFFLQSDAQLGTWGSIVPYLIIYGIGRGTYENINKAVVADYYAHNPDASISAYAAITFANGLSGSVGYFMFIDLDRIQMATIVLVTSILATLCFLISDYIHKNNNFITS